MGIDVVNKEKKVLFISETSETGVLTVISALLELCLQKGMSVTYVYSSSRASSRFYLIKEKLEQHYKSQVTFIEVPMKHQISLYDLVCLFKIFKILAEDYSFIHAHSSKAGALTRISGLFRPSVLKKIIYSPHAFAGQGGNVIKNFFYNSIEKLLSRFSKILCVSRSELEFAKEVLGIRESNLFLVNNFIAKPTTLTMKKVNLKKTFIGSDC